MYAQLLVAQLRPNTTDQACRIYSDVLLPPLKQMGGYVASFLLTDLDAGKVVLVTIWERESDVTSYRTKGRLNADIAAFGEVLVAPPLVEVHELTSADSLSRVLDQGCPPGDDAL